MTTQDQGSYAGQIAIIGMAGRFPGAQTLEDFWRNLRDGIESISFFSDEELLAQGIPSEMLSDPKYVKAKATIENVDLFDAAFFEYSSREAALTDPQQRAFLECAWEALENAGYDPHRYPGLIGVFAGTSINSYLLSLLSMNPELIRSMGGLQTLISSDKDFLATRVSYKLDLKGPSVTVQTACSTSLVAVHLACQSLLCGESDMALAGGVSISIPQKVGYYYREEGIASPDGHCRAYSTQAQGTVQGNGVGLVVLKRLSDAHADHDHILAVIRGSAINNDGATKVGYTAPGSQGQQQVIAQAQAIAGVTPSSISLLEGHGTATAVGDPLELAVLQQVFGASPSPSGQPWCALGSVKSNIGHLDAAAGIAGLIKVVLALQHEAIPPSLYAHAPTAQLCQHNSAFYLPTHIKPWPRQVTVPRRAGMSSFGIGGTNAHVIVEEAPQDVPVGGMHGGRGCVLLLLSARTPEARLQATARLQQHMAARQQDLNSVAATLQLGRRAFGHRCFVVATTPEQAQAALSRSMLVSAGVPDDPTNAVNQVVARQPEEPSRRSFLASGQYESGQAPASPPPVVFLLPGQGSHLSGMGQDLYQREPTVRHWIEAGARWLQQHARWSKGLHEVLFAPTGAPLLEQTQYGQPALFILSYALAQLWKQWGVQPRVVLGHSLGEYVAATLAGIWNWEDGLRLVTARGRLMQQTATGTMLAVRSREPLEVLLRELGTQSQEPLVEVAADNGAGQWVLSGAQEAIDEIQQRLRTAGIATQRLRGQVAFHSRLMEPILEEWEQELSRVSWQPQSQPYLSGLHGDWVSAQEASQPSYWVKQVRAPVRFGQAVSRLWQQRQDWLWLEVGPGQALSRAVRGQVNQVSRKQVFVTLPPAETAGDSQAATEEEQVLATLGRLWLRNIAIDWEAFQGEEPYERVPLPTYPFQRQRYWIEVKKDEHGASSPKVSLKNQPDRVEIKDWFFFPSWKRCPLPEPINQADTISSSNAIWLIFSDQHVGPQIAGVLERQQHRIFIVKPAEHYQWLDEKTCFIEPGQSTHYVALLQDLHTRGHMPQNILHFWSMAGALAAQSDKHFDIKDLGFYSLLFLAQALATQDFASTVELRVITSGVYDVLGSEQLSPELSMVLGPCKVIPQEYPFITCQHIDVEYSHPGASEEVRLIKHLEREFHQPIGASSVTYRGIYRWVQNYTPLQVRESSKPPSLLRHSGVYLITGGLGDIGLTLAEELTVTVQAKLVLVGRSGLPAREMWGEWLASHEANEKVSRKIRKIQQLEAQGADILILMADVADSFRMQKVVDEAIKRFGAIHGLIHAAGAVSGNAFQPIQKIQRDECEQQFRPKVQGLQVLERALRGEKLDFYLLFSSLASVLGGLGFVAYAAANQFMDTFASERSKGTDSKWISVNWDGWQFSSSHKGSPDAHLTEQSIKPPEGMEACRRILSMALGTQVVVATSDLQARIERWINPGLHSTKTRQESASFYPRPALPNAYQAPTNEIEGMISTIWKELLGIEDIGINDNFFELGGNSLIGIEIIAHIKERLNVSLPVVSLYEGPTVSALTRLITRDQQSRLKQLKASQSRGERRKERRVQQASARSIIDHHANTDEIA